MDMLVIGNGQRGHLVIEGYHDGLANRLDDQRLMFVPSFKRPPLKAEERAATLDGRPITITEITYCYTGDAYLAIFRD